MYRNEKMSYVIDQLQELGLPVMASSLDALYHSKNFLEMDKLTLLEEIVEPQYSASMTRRLGNRLKNAHLLGSSAEVENCVDSRKRAYLPEGVTPALASLDFIRNGDNVCILGPSDSGKTYLAKALGLRACEKCRVIYYHCENMMEELVALKKENFKRYQNRVKTLATVDLLILDDFLLHTIGDEREVKVLHEVLERRSELAKSMIICSQREPKSWASMILNDEVSANAILKRATKNYTVVIQPKET
ncbi:MAG: ATP-binding protein [Clostridia bacterium]|nr:ATP-binding protein [Clostridia bacterium]